MEGTVEYNESYFRGLVEEAAKEEKELMNKAELVIKNADKKTVKDLLNCDSDEFYKNLLAVVGSARYNRIRNRKITKCCDELLAEVKDNWTKDKKNSVISLLKLICAKVLGILRFTWDTTCISIGFIGRVSCNLIANLFRALVKTGTTAVTEGREAGIAIRNSFEDNILN